MQVPAPAGPLHLIMGLSAWLYMFSHEGCQKCVQNNPDLDTELQNWETRQLDAQIGRTDSSSHACSAVYAMAALSGVGGHYHMNPQIAGHQAPIRVALKTEVNTVAHQSSRGGESSYILCIDEACILYECPNV